MPLAPTKKQIPTTDVAFADWSLDWTQMSMKIAENVIVVAEDSCDMPDDGPSYVRGFSQDLSQLEIRRRSVIVSFPPLEDGVALPLQEMVTVVQEVNGAMLEINARVTLIGWLPARRLALYQVEEA